MAIPRSVARATQVLELTFNASAAIWRKTQNPDTTGGFTDTYAEVATYPCSYSRFEIRPTERETTISVESVMLWTFVFPLGSDIRNTDRIISNGRTFEVVSSASGSLELAKRVVCTEIS
jgi:hypothetical protein